MDEAGAQVLTLSGKPINWAKPPKATDLVIWSRKTQTGKTIKGSLRTIAWLDRVDSLAVRKFGKHITVIQSCYNTGVAASAGTHDYDACLDVKIEGVPWLDQQKFFRENGGGAYYRTPAQGFAPHIHLFVLPVPEGQVVSDDYMVGGFRVGKFVDGGYSLYGRLVASSQLSDYYNHRDALAGHAADHTWFPSDIRKTVFDLPAYIRRRQPKSTGKAPTVSNKRSAKIVVATNNIMALPKNPEVKKTLLSSPRASVLLVQEGNLREFKRVMASLPGYEVAGDLHAGKGSVNYSNFILYKPDVWDLVSQRYVKQYDGEDHISNTRYLSMAVLRHKVLGIECAFYSYHAVTAGNDKKRRAMRAEGLGALRRAIRVNKGKMPVFVGGDYNSKGNAHPSANICTTHGIDQQYVWNGGGATVKKDAAHVNKTTSDHDALVVDYTITIK